MWNAACSQPVKTKAFSTHSAPRATSSASLHKPCSNQIHQQFITVVKNGRGQRLKETPDMFSGLFWSGQQAVELGLADQLGNLDYVAREVVKTEEIIDYTRRENVAERLAKKFGASMGEGAMKAFKDDSCVALRIFSLHHEKARTMRAFLRA